jgi:FkbM family methyltransferase
MGFIGRYLQKRYSPPNSVPTLFELSQHLGIYFDFVIEAGSHDGTDSLELLKLPNVKKIFCFEPNPKVRDIFKENFKNVPENRYGLFEYGLFDESKITQLFLPRIDLNGAGNQYAGTSSLLVNWAKSDGTGFEVELIKLDQLIFDQSEIYDNYIQNSQGLLWLDVEGTALNALIGMKRTLRNISIAKVELEYQTQKGQWEKKNIFRVIKFMFFNGFLPYSGYLHPLSRGDMLFIKKSVITNFAKYKSIKFFILIVIFYGFIYPIHKQLVKLLSIFIGRLR